MTQGGTAAERCHIHDLGPGQSFTVRNELHFPSNVTGQPASVRITCAATGSLLRCGSPRCRPLASGHRPSIPKTTACLGRFDDVELAEALCVCDHVDRDDFAVDNPEGHGRGET